MPAAFFASSFSFFFASLAWRSASALASASAFASILASVSASRASSLRAAARARARRAHLSPVIWLTVL